jgi:hypothetical protein
MTIQLSNKDIPEFVRDGVRSDVCQLLRDLEYDKPIKVVNPERIVGFLRDLLGVLESSVDMTTVPHEKGEGVRELGGLYDEGTMCDEESEMANSLKELEDKWRSHIAESQSLRVHAELFNMDGFYPFYTQQKVRILFVVREACWMQRKN